MVKKHKIILIGDSAFAEVAYEYFAHDSEYKVVAFAVENAYLRRDALFGLPVVPFETMEQRYAPVEHFFYAAIVYTQKNALRTRLYLAAKEKGYRPASYISSHNTFIWRNVQLGEHCFVFENNVIQPFASLGNNVVLWSGNHIGHHSRIGDNTFVSSHVVISGFAQVGCSGFLGVNSTVADRVIIGDNCIVGAGSVIVGDVSANKTVVGLWQKRSAINDATVKS